MCPLYRGCPQVQTVMLRYEVLYLDHSTCPSYGGFFLLCPLYRVPIKRGVIVTCKLFYFLVLHVIKLCQEHCHM